MRAENGGTQDPGLNQSKTGSNSKSTDLDEDTKIILQQMMTNFHSMMLKSKPHIKEYLKIRSLHSEVCGSMMELFYDGKFLPKLDPNYVIPDEAKAAGAGGTVKLSTIKYDTETREGQQALCDSVIYKTAPNISCLTEEFINKHRYRKPEKVEFLVSMLNARLGLFEVTGTDLGEGYAYFRDVITGQELTLVDIALSGERFYDGIYLYTRVISYRGINFNTGLNLLFQKNDPFIKAFIKENKKDYKPLGEFSRFIDLYNHFKENPGDVKILVNTLM